MVDKSLHWFRDFKFWISQICIQQLYVSSACQSICVQCSGVTDSQHAATDRHVGRFTGRRCLSFVIPVTSCMEQFINGADWAYQTTSVLAHGNVQVWLCLCLPSSSPTPSLTIHLPTLFTANSDSDKKRQTTFIFHFHPLKYCIYSLERVHFKVLSGKHVWSFIADKHCRILLNNWWSWRLNLNCKKLKVNKCINKSDSSTQCIWRKHLIGGACRSLSKGWPLLFFNYGIVGPPLPS